MKNMEEPRGGMLENITALIQHQANGAKEFRMTPFEECMYELRDINNKLELMASKNHFDFQELKINDKKIGKLLNFLFGLQLLMFLIMNFVFYNLTLINKVLI